MASTLIDSQPKSVASGRFQNTNLFLLALIFLSIGLCWRIVDIFVLNLGATWINILPSKIFPLSILLFFFWKFRRSELSKILGLSRSRFCFHLFIGSFVGFGLIVLSIVLPAVLYSQLNPLFNLEIRVLFFDLLWYQLFFFFINAVMEETLFRGVLLNGIKTKTRPSYAIFYSSVIFGFWHIFWPIANDYSGMKLFSAIFVEVFFSTLIGILFCTYYIHFSSSTSLIGPIAAHTLLNFLNECIKIGPASGMQGPDIPVYDSQFAFLTLIFSLMTLLVLIILFSRYKIENIVKTNEQIN